MWPSATPTGWPRPSSWRGWTPAGTHPARSGRWPWFQQLVRAIKENLADVKVFLAGKPEADAFIVGRTEGDGWTGLKTKVVQT